MERYSRGEMNSAVKEASVGTKAIAKLVRVYYEALVSEGFDEETALVLTSSQFNITELIKGGN